MDTSLWSLFISAFVAATLFPGGSEAVLAYLASDNTYAGILLICVAGIGNTLGGMSSWLVGRLIAIKYSAKLVLKPKHQAAVKHIRQWGGSVLLLSWLPIVGDPLCVAAGWLRIHWLHTLLFIAIGKFARYSIIVYVFNQ